MFMKKLYRGLSWTAAFMLLFSSLALAQQRTVTGKVTDENGSSMPGVNVLVKGTTTGTATDADGSFSISVADNTAVLVFTFVGYATQEVAVGNQTSVNVTLAPDVTMLTELVVTGYATQEKKDVTGSVGIVKPKELTALPVGNVSNQLQGRVAGVTVTGSGQPGSTATVRIRGIGSFGGNDPLYVVDGVPTTDISTLNPNDVESLSVLKDAGAASIYGSRAANGVIVITTKSGTNSGVKVNYSMYTGTQFAGNGPDNLLDTQGYADLQWLVYDNDGTVETHPIYGPSSNPAPTLPAWAANTNWYDAITNNASIQNHDLSLSGGNKNAKFYAGLNYFDQNGIVNTTFAKRFAARLNSEFNIKDRVKIGENLTITHRSGLSVGNLDEGSPINAAVYRMQPIIPVRITESIVAPSRTFIPGEYGGTGLAPRLGNGSNTVASLERNQDDRSFDIRMLGNIFADVEIMKGLNFRTNFGGTFQQGYFTDYNFATYENAENVNTANFTEGAYYNNEWVWTNSATFNKKFGEHSVLAVAGVEAVKTGIGRGVSGTRAGYFSNDVSFRTLTNGASITGLGSGFNTPRTLFSYFGRVDYSFRDKYLLTATVRRDGASVFGSENKYGVFPSITGAWRISQEEFMSSVDIISDLKLRAGYGVMGNQQPISPFSQYFLFGGDLGSSFYSVGGATGGSSQGFRPTQIGNNQTQWERSITSNLGFDIALLENRVEIVFDLYRKVTDKLLFQRPLWGGFGAAPPPFLNVGEMTNSGIDLQIIYRQTFDNSLKFEGNLTFTTIRNEVTGIAPGIDFFDAGGSRIGSYSRNQVGRPAASFFGYKVIGLFQTQAEVDAAAEQDGAEPGFFRYADLNNDGEITPDDRTFIGDPNPDFVYGLNLNFEYKGFDLSAFFYGSQGNDIFNYNKWWTDFWPSFQGQKSSELLNNSWTQERGGNSVPKASNKSNFSTNTQSNSYYIEDGSFLRLRTIQLGYNLPTNIVSKVGLGSARVYLQGVNLFTLTKYSGLDPEIGGSDLARGFDAGNYPAVKQVLVGLNLGL